MDVTQLSDMHSELITLLENIEDAHDAMIDSIRKRETSRQLFRTTRGIEKAIKGLRKEINRRNWDTIESANDLEDSAKDYLKYTEELSLIFKSGAEYRKAFERYQSERGRFLSAAEKTLDEFDEVFSNIEI